jgi:ATP-dependent DNA helicase RecG
MDDLEKILNRLESCTRRGTYDSLETDWLEVKPVPATGNAWDSIRESICAFLNTRGGILLLGVKDEQKPDRHYVFTGYTEDQSGQLSDLRKHFKDARRNPMDVGEFIRFEVRPFMDGQVVLVRVSGLPEDRKFCLFREEAFERVADRDERIVKTRVQEQEERKREMETFRELRPVEGVTLEELSLQRVNELIFLINQGQAQPIESLKSAMQDAAPFLERRRFLLKDRQITTLGMLVVGKNPEEHLLFRSHLDAFVAVPNLVAQDKKTFRDNILQLMEAGQSWTLRNIQTGVSHEAGGTSVPEYPDKLIRECINNALAHRDYSINRPVQLTLKPRESLEIRNPGHLPHELVFEKPDEKVPVRRIFPNPRARNPRLADVLKLHSKWEGKGIGMSDLVNYALGNKIDLPYYLFHSADELSLCIPSGMLLDEAMVEWLELMNGLIAIKTKDRPLTIEHRMVLAYLLKSERNNRLGRYTLALTPSNNHFEAITNLKSWGLIELHPASDQFREVYLVCRELAEDDHYSEIRELVGADFDRMDEMNRMTLNMISIAEKHSKQGGLNAKQVYRLIRHRLPEELRKRGEDEFYRAVRYRIEKMAPDKNNRPDSGLFDAKWHSVPERMLSVLGPSNRPTFRLNRGFQKLML